MRRQAFVLLIAVLLFSSLALAQKKAAGKAVSSGAPDKVLMQKINDAWGTMDPDNAAKYYDKSASDVFYDVAPLKYSGWAEYVAGAKQLLETLKSIKFVVNDDAVVHRASTLAWGTATVKTTMTDKSDKTTNLDCRWTVVWEKKGADWLIVHEHFSVPMEMPK